ncbi:hypothetical protein [Atopobacter phocae]|uniref:hypothetical protein n=1 Tax=Atopobacter phocae TaxID=136492 RepID=UPI00047281B9|nr:hypothetical protein [Atopobacter phocae]
MIYINSAKLIFSDNSTLVLTVNSNIFGLRFLKNDADYGSKKETFKMQHMFPLSASEYPLLKLDIHKDAGILPSITELLENYPYFYIEEEKHVVYSSKAVIRIELID